MIGEPSVEQIEDHIRRRFALLAGFDHEGQMSLGRQAYNQVFEKLARVRPPLPARLLILGL
jgi:hypothetical protein